MKHTLTLLLLACLALSYAQTPIAVNHLPAKRPDAASLAAAKQQLLQHKHSVPSGERAPIPTFYIDHGVLDQEYAANVTFGDYYEDAIYQINRRAPLDSTYIAKWAFTRYSRIIDMVNNPNWPYDEYPPQSITMVLDTIWLGLGHIRNSALQDTIKISVWDYDALALNTADSGAGGILYGTVTRYTDTSLTGAGTQPGTVNVATVPFVPSSPIQIPQGKRFVIQVDFFGPTSDEFYLICGRRNDCGNATCGANIPYVNDAMPGINFPFNSLLGLKQNNTVYPSTDFYNDCNSNQMQDTAASWCEFFVAQDLTIYPNIVADIDFFGYIGITDTNVCPSTSIPLSAHAGGSDNPTYTYEWATTNGTLSSTSDPFVNLSIGIVDAMVYLTVTDGANQTKLDSVLVHPTYTACIPYDTVSGYVFFDVNTNGVKDAGDIPYQVQVRGDNQHLLSDTAGFYQFYLRDYGTNHTVALPYLFQQASYVTPAGGSYSLAPGPNYTGKNFALNVSPDSNNVRVRVIDYAFPAKPGFDSYYDVRVENMMTATFNGTVKLYYDSLMVPDYFWVGQPNVDTTNRVITWNVTNLAGGSSVGFFAIMITSPNAVLGSIVTNTAEVIPDINFQDIDATDNTFVLAQTVVGAFDPNDKSVSPIGAGGAHSILPGEELTYTIRFQNTGTFYAENVIVTDTIDSDLDMNTFRMVHASHAYVLETQGQNLAWYFNHIMLPDSNANEPESHGYIQYKIKPKTTVADQSLIENTAYIYFDFNSAVVTNTTSSQIDFGLSIGNITGSTAKVWVYPNPFSSETNFVLDKKITEPLTLKVFDVTGRLMDEQRNISASPYKYSQSKLTKGIYSFSFENNGIVKARGKMVVQ